VRACGSEPPTTTTTIERVSIMTEKLFIVKVADEVMVWDIPMVAENAILAETRVRYTVPNGLLLKIVSVVPVVSAGADKVDALIESVESWWGAWCDYADGNDNVTEVEWEGSIKLMHRIFDAVYAAEYA
jgi:hypothetical protein